MSNHGLTGPFEQLAALGVLDTILPFALIFTILYAVLQKTKIIGEGHKNFNITVALIVSIMVVVPHVMGTYPPGTDVVDIINTALPQVSLVVVAILSVLLLIGVFAPGVMFEKTGFGGILALFSVGAVIFIFGNAIGWWDNFSDNPAFAFLQDQGTQSVLLALLVFGIIVFFVTRESKESEETMADNIKNFFLGRGGGH